MLSCVWQQKESIVKGGRSTFNAGIELLIVLHVLAVEPIMCIAGCELVERVQ